MESNLYRTALSAIVLFTGIAAAQPLSAQSLSVIPTKPGDLDPATATAPDVPVVDSIDGKIHAQLRGALDASARGVAVPLSASHLPKALRNDDKVLVEVRFTDATNDATDILQRHGAVLRHSMGATVQEAWIPLDRLRELAGEPSVVIIRPARLVRPLIGSKTSEGVAAGNANLWQTFPVAPPYDGTGIKIAMIDTYDNSKIASLQTSKDWPATAKLSCYDVKNIATNPPYTPQSCTSGTFGSSGGHHGNATMEIAYDVAPGASFLAYDTVTVGDWYNAILDAAHLNSSGGTLGAVKANVISASLAAPLDGKGDGSALPGSIAQAAGFAKTQGVLVVNAAGNEQENHWGGLFKLSTTGSGFHTWSGSNTIYNPYGDGTGGRYCIPDGDTIYVDLYWNHWTGTSPGLDHTVYLYQDTSTTSTANWFNVAFSSTPEGVNNSLPQQSLQYTASGGATGGCPAHSASYAIAVTKNVGVPASTNYNLQLFATTDDDIPINFRVASSSLDFPADSANVLSVAAIDVANTTTTPLEPFSSEGPVLASGGGVPPNNPLGDTNLKPDLASFDNVTTVTYGAGGKDPPLSTTFLGTSAATPHAAGMAALFMQKFGVQTTSANLTNNIITPLRTIASTGANDLGATGKDYQYGYGRLKFAQDASFKFLQQPTNTVANATMTPAVKVEVIDTAGLLDPYTLYTSATLAIGTNPSGGTLTGGGSQALTAGVATFSGLKIDKAGTGYTLKATSTPAAITGTSSAFNITAATATHLAFLVQPSNEIAGDPITPTVQVAIEDASNNVVTTATNAIELLKTTCTPVVPDGGGPIAAVNGVASFPNLTLNTVANGVMLQASTSGFSAITSNAFNVTSGDTIFANGFEAGCVP